MLYGEALLTLEPARRKVEIVAEAARQLRPNSRYGIHELLLTPEDLPGLPTAVLGFVVFWGAWGAVPA